jgi:hypothetical protein
MRVYKDYFDFCLISFYLKKNKKLLLHAFKAANFLFCLSRKKTSALQ